nr:MMPL family transporter [Nakamurella flavida]
MPEQDEQGRHARGGDVPEPDAAVPAAAPAGRVPSGKRSVLRALGLLAVVAVWLGIASVGGPAIGSLSSVQSNDQEAFLPAGAEAVLAQNAAAGFTDATTLPAFVVFSTDTPATADQLAAWRAFAQDLPGTPVTRDGVDLGTVGRYLASSGGVTAPITVVPSQDGLAALAVVPLAADAVQARDADGESPLGDVVDAVRAAALADAAGGQAHVAGPAGLVSDLSAAFGGIDGILLLVALSVVLVILFVVYRAIALPFVVLFTSICGLAAAGGVVYLLADNDVIRLNGQSQGILFILTVGAATDYGLLLVARYREELLRHESRFTAIARAWRACVEPIAASAGTVIIGLLCLLLSDLNSNKSLGPIGAIGIACALVAALTLLPALLMVGRWLFWPRIPHAFARVAGSGAPAGSAGRHAAPAAQPEVTGNAGKLGLWGRIAAFVGRNPRKIWVVTAVVLALACLAVPTLKSSGTAQTDVFLTDVDSIAGQDQLVEHFPGGSGNPVVIIAPQGSVDEVRTALAGVAGLAPDPTVVSAQPGGDGAPLVVDGRVQIQATLTAASDSAEARATVEQARTVLHALPDGADILVGGTTAIQLDTLDTAERDLGVIIPAILLAVLLVLIALLRSIVAPLLLVAATVLSFGTALGVAALVFNNLFDFPGADPAVPLFAFVFLVALGIDYSIFLMTRAREESALHGTRDGVLRALRVTGGVITSAGIVLAATFAALAVIPILFLAQIAFIVAFGVLLDTLIVRTLLVPALTVDLGDTVWWPSRPTPTRHQLELIERERTEQSAESAAS